MFRKGGIKAVRARASARVASLPLFSSLPSLHESFPAPLVSSLRAPRAIVPLLLAEAAAFALASGSGKIPAFLFTAVRALLTF
jgi:hypothetical protein